MDIISILSSSVWLALKLYFRLGQRGQLLSMTMIAMTAMTTARPKNMR